MGLKFWSADVSGLFREQVKAKLWGEIRLKAELGAKGINISDAALGAAQLGDKFVEQKLGGAFNRKLATVEFPACIYLHYGLKVRWVWNEESPHVIDLAGGKPSLIYREKLNKEAGYDLG
jgi:plastocyanin